MSGNGYSPERPQAGPRHSAGEPIELAMAARRRARLVSGLRDLAQAGGSAAASVDPSAGREQGRDGGASADAERCDLCGTVLPEDHRHLLQLSERRIDCVCESCWALRSGDPEYRPSGSRVVWLPELEIPEELWTSFQIPIGLAFFMHSTTAGCVVALYPSPAGATESELHFTAWSRLVELNPILAGLEPDIEGLIVDRLTEPATHLIAPIDQCYALTGLVKTSWEGISGGRRVQHAVSSFLERLRAQAAPA